MVRIKKWIVHPNTISIGSETNNCQKDNWTYDGSIMDWDIVMLVLQSYVRFNQYIQPACLPSPSYDLHENDEVYASGWGATKSIKKANEEKWKKTYELFPKTAKLKVVSQAECKSKYESSGDSSTTPPYNSASFACILGVKQRNEPTKFQGPCQGDSGGNLPRNSFRATLLRVYNICLQLELKLIK